LREMMLQGVLSIAEGLNQKLIRMQLEAYAQKNPVRAKAEEANGGARTAPAPVES